MKMTNNSSYSTSSESLPPKNYLAESILATIFCCLPFGIIGIINAARVENAFYSGDETEAERLSRQALKWVKIAFFTGIASVVIYLVCLVVFVLQGANDF